MVNGFVYKILFLPLKYIKQVEKYLKKHNEHEKSHKKKLRIRNYLYVFYFVLLCRYVGIFQSYVKNSNCLIKLIFRLLRNLILYYILSIRGRSMLVYEIKKKKIPHNCYLFTEHHKK